MNSQLVESFILSLSEKFFVFADPEIRKEKYLNWYQLQARTGSAISKPSEDMSFDDIPF